MASNDQEALKLFEVPEIVSANLKDLDIALGQIGEMLATVISRIRELESGSTEGDQEALVALLRKLEQSWELYILLEETIARFPTIHRAQYYGPFRDSTWSKVAFLDTPHGKAFVARTTSVFEGFLVHLESVLDSILKTISQKRYKPPSWLLGLSGMGGLISLWRRDPQKFGSVEGSVSLEALQDIMEHFEALDDIRAYRNFVVHYGTIPLRGTVVRTPTGYLDGKVTGSRIRRISNSKWDVSEDKFDWFEGFDVALFSRYALWRVITVAEVALSRFVGKIPEGFPR
jgi:hypothetical protein